MTKILYSNFFWKLDREYMHMYVCDIIWKVKANSRNLNQEKFSHGNKKKFRLGNKVIWFFSLSFL